MRFTAKRPEVCCFVFFVAVTLVNTATAADTISDASLGFSFFLPDGFVEIPGGTRDQKLHRVFMRFQTEKSGMAFLAVVSIGGTISPGKLDRKIVEQAARDSVRGSPIEMTKFEYRPVNWKGLDLEVLVAHAKGDEQTFRILSAQVPLAKEAIVLSLGGPSEDETRLLAEFAMLLGSVEGKSNWLTVEEHSESGARLIGRIVGALVGPAVVIFLVLRRRYRAKGRPQDPRL
jgi:hypothetical protein